MEPHRGPRANRSRKNLPAAFSTGGPRHPGGALENIQQSPRVSRAESERVLGIGVPAPPPPPESVVEGDEQIRLDALVFLSSIPQRHGNFVIKKMLHPPTLELFCLMEIPGAEHQRSVLRARLQEWLARWSVLQEDHRYHLVELREAFWDAPQGYPMAVLCEYMPLGSLEDLIQACGGLPEEALREVAQLVLEALDILHSAQPPVVHGCLKPSQVLFSADGRPRLNFGLEQRIKACQVWHADGVILAGNHHEQTTAVDIFDLGLLLLVSALGGMDVLLDAIPYARSLSYGSGSGGVSGDTCSLLLQELRGSAAGTAVAGDASSGDVGYLPAAADLLFNRRYSQPFLAFVSSCLEAHTQRAPVSAASLLQHHFLVDLEPQGMPLVTLREMQAVARQLNEAPETDPSRFGPSTRRSVVPGVAPSVAQSSQLYLMNIAQSIAPYCPSWPPAFGRSSAGDDSLSRARAMSEMVLTTHGSRTRWHQEEWDKLLTDTARTLGLSRTVVQTALEAQLERLLQASARDRRSLAQPIS